MSLVVPSGASEGPLVPPGTPINPIVDYLAKSKGAYKAVPAISGSQYKPACSRIDGAQVLRPRAKAANALLRVHTRACRLAATKPDIMAHREVARAIEQELIVALVNVVANAESA